MALSSMLWIEFWGLLHGKIYRLEQGNGRTSPQDQYRVQGDWGWHQVSGSAPSSSPRNCEENGIGVQKGCPEEEMHLWKPSRAGGHGCIQSQLVGTPQCWTVVLPPGDSLTPVKHSQKLGEPLETSCSGVGWSVKDRIQTNQRKKKQQQKRSSFNSSKETKMKQMQNV